MCERIDSVLREIFPSPEMAAYLAKCTLRKESIRDMVAYAAIPLNRKRDIFLRLASEKDTAYFRRQADDIALAIQEMQPKPGEFFYLNGCYFDENKTEEEGLKPYLTWEHILEGIQEYLGDFEADEKELVWFRAEKWSPDGSGRLKNDYDYIVLSAEVCYFTHNAAFRRSRYDFSMDRDLNLPVPFRPGDIVTVDCRPFAPVSYAVILEVGDNRDCCCLQSLFRNDNGTWETGAVKHGHIGPNGHVNRISPLYRLASFRGQLPEEDDLLERVSRYLNGDEKRGSALWHYIFERRVDTVTKEEILAYMKMMINTISR